MTEDDATKVLERANEIFLANAVVQNVTPVEYAKSVLEIIKSLLAERGNTINEFLIARKIQ